MKILISFILATSFLFLPSVFAQVPSGPSQAGDQFAFDLYSRLSTGDNNIFFSPYSLSTALGMAYEGARGQTADEMRTVLHLPSDEASRRRDVSALILRMNRPDNTYELSIANALWTQKGFTFLEDYLNLVKGTYDGEAQNLDFKGDPEGSRMKINGWVSDNTKDRIKNLLPPGSIRRDTRLVLTNAVYFKGKWAVPFNKTATRLGDFWITPTASVQTDMMGLSGKSFKYVENDQAQVVELPYQGDELSMLIVLPRVKDVRPVEKAFSEAVLNQWDMAMLKQGVNVFIPIFKFDVSYMMGDVLREMGMKNAFDPHAADFSGMTGRADLFIDQVYHKAWIDVNEEGTEAAGATAVVMMQKLAMMAPVAPKIFRADHPFLFIIRENQTGHILFMGRVSDPREK